MADDRSAVPLFVTVLGVTKTEALSLIRAGISTIEEVAYVPVSELMETPGVSSDLLSQAREKARAYLAV
jgi:transcription termination factor NusA